jgi:diketogulonate reductase-like aldo/keto reductase
MTIMTLHDATTLSKLQSFWLSSVRLAPVAVEVRLPDGHWSESGNSRTRAMVGPMTPGAAVMLRNGLEWPLLGLGTYRLTPVQISSVVSAALGASYGLIDTAVSYRHSHGAISEALTSCNGPRDGPPAPSWIQTKIPPAEQGYERARACALRCASELHNCGDQLSVILHWPGASKLPPDSPMHAELRLGSWLALQELYREGVVQCIGVSNFTERHLRELEAAAGVQILPLVNQVELHPLLPQRELRAYCAERAIHVQAYSSLGQGNPALWRHPAVLAAAERLGVSVAHVLLLWAMRQGVSVIPRTQSPERVVDNARTLGALLPDGGASALDELDGLADGTHFCWDPTGIR